MGALWTRKGGGGGKIHPQTPRRSLFELHRGRQVRELPSNLLLEEINPTRRLNSKLNFTTSEDLIAALGPIGREYVNDQEAKGKVNLSYVSNPVLLALDRREAIKEARKAEREANIARRKGVHPINLKGLLVQYLLHVDPKLKYQARLKNPNSANKQLDKALLKVLNDDNAKYLDRGGWDVTDLMNWTWILTSETTERAATRLLAVVAYQGPTKIRMGLTIPQFVFTFLLRRRDPSAEALRAMLIYAWKLMEKLERWLEPLPPPDKLANEALRDGNSTKLRIVKSPEDDTLGMKEAVFMIMIIRLLRSAVKVWPAACDDIADLINRYLDGLNFRQGASRSTMLTSEDTAQLTYMYNTLLKLVSLPASIGPFESAFHQQRAQFSLLRRMNQFQPPLIVDRRGYRAVVSMQLRHKKTLKEREWAQMKARSWPPWKEEKLGIDADINTEHGISRAMEAMRRSWEAGYAPDNWDAVASILSGWDIDGSPTIQTRVVRLPYEHSPEDAKIWASRIRATRTLDEAWSCFLSYKAQKLRPLGAFLVYHQMFEKIVQDAKRLPAEEVDPTSANYAHKQQPLPGDGLEVWATPESPREAVYVPRPPPNIDEFVKMMARDKIKPGTKFLSDMLANAPTLETGLQYLKASPMSRAQVRVLSDRNPPRNLKAKAALRSIPISIFSSFIRLLARFSPRMPDGNGVDKFTLVDTGSVLYSAKVSQLHILQRPSNLDHSPELAPSLRPVVINPLLKAIQLVLARKPRHRPAWYNLLRPLSESRVVTDVVSRLVDQEDQDIKTWRMTCLLINEMLDIGLNLDLEGFRILCVGLEKSIFASERLSRYRGIRQENNDPGDDTTSYVDHVLSTGLPLLKEIFKNIVRSKFMRQEIPVSLRENKTKIDKSVEEHDASESDEIGEGIEDVESRAFIPPACLLPRLLEAPNPACLHSFIRVLGLRRDYDGLLDLVEWMSLFADEINAVADEKASGHRIMRRCLTATHVFMERSWISLEKREAELRGEDPSTVRNVLEMKAEPAPEGIVRAVQEIVRQNQRWGGWPEPHEVVQYCANGKFI